MKDLGAWTKATRRAEKRHSSSRKCLLKVKVRDQNLLAPKRKVEAKKGLKKTLTTANSQQ